jgi:hypothetical protein
MGNQTILTWANAVTVIGMWLPLFNIVYRDCWMWFLHQIGTAVLNTRSYGKFAVQLSTFEYTIGIGTRGDLQLHC